MFCFAKILLYIIGYGWITPICLFVCVFFVCAMIV